MATLVPFYDRILDELREQEGLTQDQADTRYVNISGDTMTGDLNFPVNGIVLSDGSGNWRVTLDATGHFVTVPA